MHSLILRSAALIVVLPLFAQQPGGEPSESKAAAAELTGEGYRDLILNTADGMQLLETYGDVGPGVGAGTVDGRQVACAAMLTVTSSKAQNAAKRREVWAGARVPQALKPSQTEILKWMESAAEATKRAPKCILPLFQSTMPQLIFFGVMGQYEDHRKSAALALKGMGVTLPILKPAPKK